MKQALITVWLIASLAWCASQGNQAKQTRPSAADFSGTWELDRSKSKLTKTNTWGKVTLSVTHSVEALRIIQTRINLYGEAIVKEFAYYTDSRGETNPANFAHESFYEGGYNYASTSPRTFDSKSRWKGKKIQTSYAIFIRLSGNRRTMVDVQEEWELSSDGRTLTQTTEFSSHDPNFDTAIEPRKLKKVFKKTS